MRTWTTLSGAVHVGRLPDAPVGSSPPKNPKNLNPALADVPSCQTQRLAGPVRCTRFGLASTAAQAVKEIRCPARAQHCPEAAEGVLEVGGRTLGRHTQEKHTRLCGWRGPLKPDILFVLLSKKEGLKEINSSAARSGHHSISGHPYAGQRRLFGAGHSAAFQPTTRPHAFRCQAGTSVPVTGSAGPQRSSTHIWLQGVPLPQKGPGDRSPGASCTGFFRFGQSFVNSMHMRF